MNEITNTTPKFRFIESGNNVTQHRKMVDQPEFQRACDFAMLSFSLAVSQTPITQEELSLGAAGLKLRGAQDFLSIFRNLSEQPKVPSNIVPVGLNHRT